MHHQSLIVAEPVGRHARKPPLVVDCSVLAAVLFDEPSRDEAMLVMAGKALFVPDLIHYEMLSVALKKMSKYSEAQMIRALQDLADLELTRHPIDPISQFQLARETGLSADDAAYLQLAIELKAPLATFDKTLGRAAESWLTDGQA